jgi:hypothetical protein
MTRRLRRLLLILALPALLLLLFFIPTTRYVLRGVVNGEPFFHGRPTSYWKAAILEWDAEGGWNGQSNSWIKRVQAFLGIQQSTSFLVGLRAIVPPAVLEGGPEAMPVLQDLMRDLDPTVRGAAALALGNLGPGWDRPPSRGSR